MSICNGCGGVVGRDCFNPGECEWIARDIERRQMQESVSQAARSAAIEILKPAITKNSANGWTLQSAAAFCRIVEGICPEYGCHVALTGGSLYKDGERKDCDILFYRIRQAERIDSEGLIKAMQAIGIEIISAHGWVTKAKFHGKGVDIFFPEDYPEVCESY